MKDSHTFCDTPPIQKRDICSLPLNLVRLCLLWPIESNRSGAVQFQGSRLKDKQVCFMSLGTLSLGVASLHLRSSKTSRTPAREYIEKDSGHQPAEFSLPAKPAKTTGMWIKAILDPEDSPFFFFFLKTHKWLQGLEEQWNHQPNCLDPWWTNHKKNKMVAKF